MSGIAPAGTTGIEIEFRSTPILAGDELPVEVVDLGQHAARANPFFDPELLALGQCLPEGRELYGLYAWRRAASGPRVLDGFLPLQQRQSLAGLHSWAGWGHRHCYLGEPLIRADRETAFWRTLFGEMQNVAHPLASLRLSNLLADSRSTRALLEVAQETGRPYRWNAAFERAFLVGGATSAEYLAANVRKKKRKELNRLRNRLADAGRLAVTQIDGRDDATLEAAISGYLHLERESWKGRAGTAFSCDPDDEGYFRGLVTTLARRGQLSITGLALDDAPIAYLVTALTAPNDAEGRGAYTLKTTYDERYAAFSPGVLVQLAFLEYALDVERLDWVDSCASAQHPMIDSLWKERRAIGAITVALGAGIGTYAMHVENAIAHGARAVRGALKRVHGPR